MKKNIPNKANVTLIKIVFSFVAAVVAVAVLEVYTVYTEYHYITTSYRCQRKYIINS